MKTLFNVLGGLCCAAVFFMVLGNIVSDRAVVNAAAVGTFGGGALTCFFCAALLDRLDQIIVRLGLLPAATPKALLENPEAETVEPAPAAAPVSNLAEEYEKTVRAMRESLRKDPDIAEHIARKQAPRS